MEINITPCGHNALFKNEAVLSILNTMFAFFYFLFLISVFPFLFVFFLFLYIKVKFKNVNEFNENLSCPKKDYIVHL